MSNTTTNTTILAKASNGYVTLSNGLPGASLAQRVIGAPTRVELHLNVDTDLAKKHGKAIKGLGGKYSDVRGSKTKRYVTLPLPAGRELADTLLAGFGAPTYAPGYTSRKRTPKPTTVIFRGAQNVTDQVVHANTMDDADALYAKHIASAVERGELVEVTQADIDADAAERARIEQNHECDGLKITLNSVLEQVQALGIAFSTDERLVIDALIARAEQAKE